MLAAHLYPQMVLIALGADSYFESYLKKMFRHVPEI